MSGETDLAMIEENIEEYVNDENRVVTCKWLSLTLNVNINVAKRALHTFVEHSRDKKPEGSVINVTYFVAGLGKSKTGELEHKCVVVPESELDAVRKSLSVVTTCHLYSVQATKLKDYIPLYQTDYDIIKQNLDQCSSHSSIKCSWVAQRAVRQPTIIVSNPKTDKNESASTTPSASSVPTSSSVAKTTKKAEPKGSIASMFASGGQKKGGGVIASATSKASDQKVVSKSNNNNNKTKPAPKKGVQSFFNSNGVSKKTSPENKTKIIVKTEEKQKETVKTKKTEESDDEPDMTHKRRIRNDLFDSSEDEDEEEDAELEEELKQEPQEGEEESVLLLSAGSDDDNGDRKDGSPVKEDREERSVKPPEGVEIGGATRGTLNGEGATREMLNGGGRKRKRAKKTVVKQFQDEDGFLVTKKEVVWESESDHSEPEEVMVVEEPKNKVTSLPVKQNPRTVTTNKKVEPKGKLTTKKLASPQKGKQTSLTSFFQKK